MSIFRKSKKQKSTPSASPSPTGIGQVINLIQTLFVAILRVWSIPIVLMLSIASGFTTYSGMKHFIVPWIALIITVAIQSIVVICSLEIAGIHWRANRFRYFSVLASLLVAVAASVSFSYFKFYEVSQHDNIYINRFINIKKDVNNYLNQIMLIKSDILEEQHKELEKTSEEVTQAYFGTHPKVLPQFKNQIGEGPFWRRYNQIYQEKKKQYDKLEKDLLLLDNNIRSLQSNLNYLKANSPNLESTYQKTLTSLQDVQLTANQLSTMYARSIPEAPFLMPVAQLKQDVKPSFEMWNEFSMFAFICAAMVDFFTILLSYRLEFTAPGPLTEREKGLVFQCLREFTEFRINENDELEMSIEKTPIEKARRYSDWSRMFAVGLLLNRGFLRKIDEKSVEFAPNLYPLIAEHMGIQLDEVKTRFPPVPPKSDNAQDAEAEVVTTQVLTHDE